jgi:hypothetical protein
LQASTSFSSSCNHSQPPALPPPVAPRTTCQVASSLNAR